MEDLRELIEERRQLNCQRININSCIYNTLRRNFAKEHGVSKADAPYTKGYSKWRDNEKENDPVIGALIKKAYDISIKMMGLHGEMKRLRRKYGVYFVYNASNHIVSIREKDSYKEIISTNYKSDW